MSEKKGTMKAEKNVKGKKDGDVKHTDIAEMFKQLHSKALQIGLEEKDFIKLKSLKTLKKQNITSSFYSKLFSWVFLPLTIIITLLVFCYLTNWPISNRKLISIWFHVLDAEPEKEPCLLETNEYFVEMARPPTSCEFCRGLKKVDRVEKISSGKFEALYAYTARPVVVTDGTKNWTAPKVFSYKFFKEIYSDGSPALENVENDCQFFPYKTNFGNLREVFEMSEDRATMKDGSEPWYIGWSNCDFSAANTLREHYSRPYFLPNVAESSKTDWIFMGSPGYGAHMHIDNVEHPSWQAQITGTKMWTLEPPPECYYECHSKIEVVVNPGDIIVIDTNRWYHSTLNVGTDISITIGSEYD